MSEIKAYGAQSAESGVHPMSIQRRAPRPDDVAIKIDYCGVCHTDIHFAENDWGRTLYPVVPGHEIIGHVTAVGDDVSGFKVGDVVGVGGRGRCVEGTAGVCAARNLASHMAWSGRKVGS